MSVDVTLDHYKHCLILRRRVEGRLRGVQTTAAVLPPKIRVLARQEGGAGQERRLGSWRSEPTSDEGRSTKRMKVRVSNKRKLRGASGGLVNKGARRRTASAEVSSGASGLMPQHPHETPDPKFHSPAAPCHSLSQQTLRNGTQVLPGMA